AGDIRVLTALDVLNPGAVHTDRHEVLRLAGDCAGVTADTHPIVDDKAVAHGAPWDVLANHNVRACPCNEILKQKKCCPGWFYAVTVFSRTIHGCSRFNNH